MSGHSTPAMKATTQSTTTSVAGASGDAATEVLGVAGGGASADLMASLMQIAKTLEALVQALNGSSNLGGGPGQTAPGKSGVGGEHGMGGMEGCSMGQDMMGKTTPPSKTMPPMKFVDDSDVGGKSGDGSGTAPMKFTLPGSKTGVGGENGEGDDDKLPTPGKPPILPKDMHPKQGGLSPVPAPDKLPDGTTAPGKSDVDVSQRGLDAAQTKADTAARTLVDANKAVAAKQTAVTSAQGKLDAAITAKTTADENVVATKAAYEAAKAANGSHSTIDGDTVDSIASQYGITKEALLELNPNLAAFVQQSSTSDGMPAVGIPAGTLVKLPIGVGTADSVATTRIAYRAAITAAGDAAKAVEAARIALEAAKQALEAAKTAVKAAQKAVTEAEKAVTAAQSKLDAAVAAKDAAGKALEDAKAAEKKKAEEATAAAAKAAADKKAADIAAAAASKEKAAAIVTAQSEVKTTGASVTKLRASIGQYEKDLAQLVRYERSGIQFNPGSSNKPDIEFRRNELVRLRGELGVAQRGYMTAAKALGALNGSDVAAAERALMVAERNALTAAVQQRQSAIDGTKSTIAKLTASPNAQQIPGFPNSQLIPGYQKDLARFTSGDQLGDAMSMRSFASMKSRLDALNALL